MTDNLFKTAAIENVNIDISPLDIIDHCDDTLALFETALGCEDIMGPQECRAMATLTQKMRDDMKRLKLAISARSFCG